MTQHAWLARRAALALILMIGFYALAIGAAAVLLSIAYGIVILKTVAAWKVALICVAAAAAILWAIVPRFDRFVPPGPVLSSEHDPALFGLIQNVANATAQAMPAEVYLLNDVNAFVAQRGGVMGLGSRRVMGVGLPLLQVLSVQELKAVLAHEFGHYHAGDVRLGPWIYKTRAAIERTVRQLSDSFLQRIFVAYGNLFLRLTHAISRRQEFIADELAARVAGAPAMISGLRRVHGASIAFRTYWHAEVAPVLTAGHLPPIVDGFDRFMHNDRIVRLMQEAVAHQEAEGETNAFDTHPSLRDRVAALTPVPPRAEGDSAPAISLLANPAGWERRLLGASVNEEWARSLTPLQWDDVISAVYVPAWRAQVKEHAGLIRNVTISALPFARSSPISTAAEAMGLAVADPATALKLSVAAAALSLALLDRGWMATTAPGEEVVLRCDGHELKPYSDLAKLAQGEITESAWAARCASMGIQDLPLDVHVPGRAAVAVGAR